MTQDTIYKESEQVETALTVTERLQIMKAEQDAKFALTPVGQELQRFQINQRMGQMYAQSSIVPEMYQGNVANCAIAVDMAMRMGANALMVMQNLYIVHGTPGWSSKFLIATVNTCGRFKPLKFKFSVDGKIGKHDYYENEWAINSTTGRKEKKRVKKVFDGSDIDNIVCVAYTSEKGSDDILESVPVDCRLAVTEGWWTKNESKWPSMTRLMLTYRAAAFWIRSYAPELSMGFQTVEEVQDIFDVDYEDVSASVTPAKKPRRTLADLAKENAESEALGSRFEVRDDESVDVATGEVSESSGSAECRAQSAELSEVSEPSEKSEGSGTLDLGL